MKRTTIKDISLIIGVNPSTVSRALHDHPDISPAIKAEVKRVAEELKYHPNQMAANLRKNRSQLIGLIIPEITMFFFPSVIRGIEAILKEEGFRLLVLQSNDSLEVEKSNLRICRDYLVDGVLLSLSSESTNSDHIEELREIDIPVVLFDKSLPGAGFDEVLIDDVQASLDCVRYLISLGCRRIVGLFGHPDMVITKNRLRGYQMALEESAEVDKSIPALFAKTKEEARNRSREWIRKYNPDAFFFMSDELAAGLLPAIKSEKLVVPEKCKVIGISDGQLPFILDPPISFFHHDGFELGQLAARQLIYRIKNQNDSQPGQIIFQKGSIQFLESA
jgi:LacI family transcriptional regulator